MPGSSSESCICVLLMEQMQRNRPLPISTSHLTHSHMICDSITQAERTEPALAARQSL